MSFALAQPQLDAIADACRRHRVARMDVFGSVLRSDYRPGESDIDLLVEFLPLDSGNLYKASQIDLVMADAVRNPCVKQSIEARKQQIYTA